MGVQKFITPAAQLAFIALAAAGTFGFVRTAQDGELRRRCGAFCLSHPTYAAANKVAPDFELAGHKGERLSLASLKGKTVLLNFWSMTCAPCMEEMPDLAELAKTLADARAYTCDVSAASASSEGARRMAEASLGEGQWSSSAATKRFTSACTGYVTALGYAVPGTSGSRST
jgi:hypothetical protein